MTICLSKFPYFVKCLLIITQEMEKLFTYFVNCLLITTQEMEKLFTYFVNCLLITTQEMEKLVDEGLVRAIGLSNVNKQQLQRIYEKSRIKPANLQVFIPQTR